VTDCKLKRLSKEFIAEVFIPFEVMRYYKIIGLSEKLP